MHPIFFLFLFSKRYKVLFFILGFNSILSFLRVECDFAVFTLNNFSSVSLFVLFVSFFPFLFFFLYSVFLGGN